MPHIAVVSRRYVGLPTHEPRGSTRSFFSFNSRGILIVFEERRGVVMSYNGYDSEAAYFDLLAQQSKDAQTRQNFQEVADTYRSLPAKAG